MPNFLTARLSPGEWAREDFRQIARPSAVEIEPERSKHSGERPMAKKRPKPDPDDEGEKARLRQESVAIIRNFLEGFRKS